jgi:hypothetical protein
MVAGPPNLAETVERAGYPFWHTTASACGRTAAWDTRRSTWTLGGAEPSGRSRTSCAPPTDTAFAALAGQISG